MVLIALGVEDRQGAEVVGDVIHGDPTVGNTDD
jgi:hypothetical protein